MRVILLQDVSGVGARGDIKEVADGYALNYLIPRKLAKFASPQMVEEARTFKRRKATAEAAKTQQSHSALKALDGKEVHITGKANDQGHLFAQIHDRDIAVAITEQHGADMSDFIIELPEPIKEVGSYKTAVSMKDGGSAIIGLVVEAEE